MRVNRTELEERTAITASFDGDIQQIEHIYGFSFQAEWTVSGAADAQIILEANNDPDNLAWSPIAGAIGNITGTDCFVFNVPNVMFSHVRFRVEVTSGTIDSFKSLYYIKGI